MDPADPSPADDTDRGSLEICQAAARLLRSLGYPKALSVAGGFQPWRKLQAAQSAQAAQAAQPAEAITPPPRQTSPS